MSSCAAPAGSPCRTGGGRVAAQYRTARFRLVPQLRRRSASRSRRCASRARLGPSCPMASPTPVGGSRLRARRRRPALRTAWPRVLAPDGGPAVRAAAATCQQGVLRAAVRASRASSPSWAILVRTSVVVRRSWSTYATDTAPLARPATAPLSQEQGLQAHPDHPRDCPGHGALSPAPGTRGLMQVNGPDACGAYWHARAARATMTGWLVMPRWPICGGWP
jgi:hypothetical protein